MRSSNLPVLFLILVLAAGCGGGGGGSGTSSSGPPVLVSIEVKPAISSILTGSTEQFTATGIYSDSSTTNLTSSVTWTTSAPGVATVSNNGLASAVSSATTATTMIMARSGNIPGAAIMMVTGGIATPAANVLPITVNGSLCSPATSVLYINKPCVSVTVCTPNTSNCQTINDILLDTGSFGLRIFSQALTGLSLTPITSGSGSLAVCAKFADGTSLWGPVRLADVTLGGETAKNVPIQVIDAAFSTVPGACGNPDADPSVAGFTGILGVGVFKEDCGSACVTSANNGMYYSCSGTCTGAKAPLPDQVSNPVALLSTNNNGVILEFPTVPSAGSQSINGLLVLGIGTSTNNVPSGVTVFHANASGDIITSFNGTYSSIIDSGSNGLFFKPPSTGLLPNCPSFAAGWFCPGSLTTLSAVNAGSSGSPTSQVYFQIGNVIGLTNSSNNVFSDVGGSNSGLFDWGLPFHFGRNIYVGIEGTSSSIGIGPYYAY